ncbi:unnamed protein product, partial [Phaeothamnion confervicola]
MYNGVGLTTPRGSGTSGHVQTNRSYVRGSQTRATIERNKGKHAAEEWARGNGGAARNKANADLLDHKRKREIEAKVFELQEAMALRGYSDAEIEAKVALVRLDLIAGDTEGGGNNGDALLTGGGSVMDSHVIAARKQRENERMASAMGVGGDYNEGDAFDRDLQEKKKAERQAAREEARRKRAEEDATRQKEKKRKQREAEKTKKDAEAKAKKQTNADRRAKEDEAGANAAVAVGGTATKAPKPTTNADAVPSKQEKERARRRSRRDRSSSSSESDREASKQRRRRRLSMR